MRYFRSNTLNNENMQVKNLNSSVIAVYLNVYIRIRVKMTSKYIFI